MARGSVKLSILSTYDDKGTQQAEKAMQKFTKQYGVMQTDGSKGSATLNATTAALAKQSIAFDQASKKWAGYSQQAMKVSKAFAPLSAAAAGLGTAAIKMASDYEQGLAKVSTIMDRTKMSTEEMGKGLLAVSNDTGRSVTEIQEATYQALSASVDTSKSVDFVRQAVNLSKAGFTQTATAVDVLTTTINAYGMSADDAASISDKLVQTQNAGKTTVDELGQNMGKVIPTAAAYGISLDQLMTGYVTLTKQGINTANSTTYLNRMFTELNKEGSTVDETLRNMTGKGFKGLMDEGKSLGDVMAILMDTVDGDSVAFANLWGSAVAGRGALAIANAGTEEFNKQLEAMKNSTGTVDKALEDLVTPAGMANKAVNSLKNTAIELGEVFLAALYPAAEKAKNVTHDLYEQFAALDDGTKQTIARTIVLVAAIAPAAAIFSKLFMAISKGYKVAATLTAWMAKQSAAVVNASRATQGYAAAQGMSSAAQAKAVVATNAATLATKAFAVAQALAKAAVLGLAIAGVMFAASKIKDYITETENLNKATKGLEGAQKNAATSFQFAAEGAKSTAISYTEMHDRATKVIEAQAEMADSITETFSEANRSQAQLDFYAQTVNELANQSGLTAEQQANLVQAVKGLNEQLGTEYQVVDAANGVLADASGATLDNVDAVNKLVEAKKREIQAEALASAAKEAYKAQADAMEELTQAQKNLEEAQKNLNKASEDGVTDPTQTVALAAAVKDAQGEVDNLQKAYDSASKAAKGFDEQQNLLTQATSQVDDEMAKAMTANNGFAQAIAGSGNSVLTLKDQLNNAGVSAKSFAKLNDEQLATIAAKYDGTFDSIAGTLQEYGVDISGAATKTSEAMKKNEQAITQSQIPQAARLVGNKAQMELTKFASNVSVGNKFSSTFAQGINTTAGNANARSLTTNASNASKNAANASAGGKSLSSTFAGGISKIAGNANAKAMAQAAKSATSGYSASSSGSALAAGFASGIQRGAYKAINAATKMVTNALSAIKTKGKEGSPWKTTMESGMWAAKGLAEGIAGGTDEAVNAASSMAQQVVDASRLNMAASTGDIFGRNLAGALAGNGNSIGELNVNLDYSAGEDANQLTRDIARNVKRVMLTR